MVSKKELLSREVKHFDVRENDATPIINAYKEMSFSARDIARASEILDDMLKDKDCTTILSLAGSTGSAGCMQVYYEMVKNNMVDAIVSTGASIVDMDFFEALGFKHYHGSPEVNDSDLRKNYVDRIYDTLIDEEELQECDAAVAKIADSLEPRPYSSREFINEMGKYLERHARKKDSLIQAAYENSVPIFVPAFSDCSAGLGLIQHQWKRPDSGKHVTIDSVKDFLELTKIKMNAGVTGVFMVGGGVPKNFVQDTVIGAEVLGKVVPMHKYVVQVTVADVRDGALSSSTLKEASSWGKTDYYAGATQMVYAEATMAVPLMASYLYHNGSWKNRKAKRYGDWLDSLKNAATASAGVQDCKEQSRAYKTHREAHRQFFHER